MKMGRVSVVVALTSVSWLAWTLFVQPSYEHRFRIFISVTTPDGQRQGSSVWSVACTKRLPGGLGSMSGGCDTSGEAIFVDLGHGRNLVGLMARGSRGENVDIYDIAAQAFNYEGVPVDPSGDTRMQWDTWAPYAPGWRGTRDLAPVTIPTLITLRDSNDPASARPVESQADRLVSIFGLGYRIERIGLEMVPVGIWPLNLIGLTGLPVTKKIAANLPVTVAKLAAQDQMPSQIYNPDAPFELKYGHLIREK